MRELTVKLVCLRMLQVKPFDGEILTFTFRRNLPRQKIDHIIWFFQKPFNKYVKFRVVHVFQLRFEDS